MKHIDILVIGAGISGSVLAERYASTGKKVLIIEKRNHIAGNCYDYVDDNGILVSKYGTHLFHTNEKKVWDYVTKFSDWYLWEHKVIVRLNDKTEPIPVNITTGNELFATHIPSEEEMLNWFEPEETCYFSDTYQALPKDGYTQLFKNILDHPNIEILLETDYFDIKDHYTDYEKLFYTGPLDRFFESSFSKVEKLEYRSINFVSETIDTELFQENSVVNYPGTEVDFTPIIEYKHSGNQKTDKTTVKEFTVDKGEPYYPVPNPQNQEIYARYKAKAEKLTDIHYVGRLANYKYFNIYQAFKNALDVFEELQKNKETIYKTTI